jgi:S-DNA-T family DNA segregation ATPase FtsK/SpoIIIE
MVVNLIRKQQLFSATLPAKVKGQFWLTDLDEAGRSRNLISIEAVQGQWVVKSNKIAFVIDGKGTSISNTVLKPLDFYNIKIKDCDEKVFLFAEPVSADRQVLKKLLVKEACELTIGRTNDNVLCFENKFASSKHARLYFDGNSWSITDTGSTNGTYVNGYRVSSQTLEPGDIIYIMGLKIVVGNRFIAVNNPDNALKFTKNFNQQYKAQPVKEREELDDVPSDVYFYRSPRFRKDFETAEINIDPPPQLQKVDQVPLALMLGPSLTMGLTSLSTGILTLSNVTSNGGDIKQALPTLFMSVSMLLGTILWPILTKKHEKKQKAINEKKRQEKYLAYLNSIRDEIKRKSKEQTDILNENLISLDECVERVTTKGANLWERIVGQSDFLRLRLGKGSLPLDAEIKYPEKKFSLEDDTLQDALLSLGKEEKSLADVPISFSFVENFISGVVGNRSEVLNLVRSLLLQIVSLHSYDEVKLAFIVDREELSEWEFVKWFPHTWNNEKTVRHLASDADEVKELSAILEKSILSDRPDGDDRKEYSSYNPYYFIISASKDLALKCESLNQLLKYKSNCGFSIVTLYDDIKNLPKETTDVIEINSGIAKTYAKDDISGKAQSFAYEGISLGVMDQIAEAIANIQMDISDQRFSLPNMITFLEMFNVSKIEHLNPLTRWKDNSPTVTLQTPVGIDTYGEPFLLDLHEKFHGPHGLVAGMTGSGKSEFIITYILSLAVNFHPDEVAFILIDYKGGGLTGAFEDTDRGIKLPHLAGTITNLDGAAVKRSLISIQSELRRRQAIFNEARKISNEGTMDIYKYQQLYRDKIVPEPVPHLFIISDEFAELKTQQPEFMEQLISAARIGRSLGIHLILATQKPSGVVDDQIWSNSKFRVCLKVQDKADSQDMIKRPDAAELSQTGRFYLQVGFNELFALGQSAWCGAKYVPSETVEKKIDSSIQLVDNLGRVLKEAKPAQKSSGDETNIKQIVGIVKYLSDLANEEKIVERPLWLEAIPALIYVGDLESKYNHQTAPTVLNPVIGQYDDPFNQRQNVLTLPISDEGNSIIYGSTGNGKTTFLTTLLYSLIKNHTADHLNIYALDFGAETLRAFEQAPQVGGVLFSNDNDKILNLFKMLSQELDIRKKQFAEFGGDYKSYCQNSGSIKPNILIVINNFAGFSELFEDLDEVFTLLSRDGLKYGIYFVVTASTTNAVRYRTQQNFGQILSLQLNDENDYAVVVGKTDGLLPSKFKGRGLVNLDRVYEFQAAHFAECKEQFDTLKAFCTATRTKAKVFARPVPVLPDVVNLSTIRNDITDLSSIPIGIGKFSLAAVKLNLLSRFVYPISAQDTYQLQQFTQGLCEALVVANNSVTVLDAEELFALDALKGYTYQTGEFEKAVQDLFAALVSRNNTYKDAKMSATSLDSFDRRIVVICGLQKLFEQLSDDGKDKLKTLLDKGEAIYKIHFILSDNASSLKTFSGEQWYRKHISGSDGIWVGDGVTEQYVASVSKMTADLYEDIGDEFGYLITRGKPILTKLISTKSSDWEGDGNE